MLTYVLRSEMIANTKNTLKKRNSILDAAIQAFQELGYENASMDYIAELANASKRTVYNHFSGKEPLFKEVIARFLSEIMQLKQIRYSPNRTLEEQLCDFADAKIAIARNPSWLGVMKVSLGVLVSHPDLARETVSQCAGMENTLASWLKEAVEDGKLEVEDTELVSKVFDSMIAGAFYWPATIHGLMDESEETKLKDEFIKTFLARYGP
jgi:TetR/AcrR family transcriptional regulator of autoinduction and epiphytic fitness